jgi:hypothetical protein
MRYHIAIFPLSMLQIGVRLSAPDGQPFGLVVIDFDLGPRFDSIKAEIAKDNRMNAVNAAGDYLPIICSSPRSRPIRGVAPRCQRGSRRIFRNWTSCWLAQTAVAEFGAIARECDAAHGRWPRHHDTCGRPIRSTEPWSFGSQPFGPGRRCDRRSSCFASRAGDCEVAVEPVNPDDSRRAGPVTARCPAVA